MNIAIFGSQFGDCGKGKIVNYFAPNYDWVVRNAGGANAGHTIYHKDKKYVNHICPSIEIEGNSRGFVASKVVVDLDCLYDEISLINKEYPDFAKRVYVDKDCHVVMPWHKELDKYFESLKKEKVGTTGRGIGPCYADKAFRNSFRVRDLMREDFPSKFRDEYNFKNKAYDDICTFLEDDAIANILFKLNELKNMGVHFVNALELKNEFKRHRILIEGAQGALLDIDYGTYPFVTSSSVCSTDFGVANLGDFENIGVFKAYCTRVGGGPFPTELDNETGEKIRQIGKEFGATTGRPRRVGWLDLPALMYAKNRFGLHSLVMTKPDVLNGFEKIGFCVSYGQTGTNKVITSSEDFFTAKPEFYYINGWKDVNDPNFEMYCNFIEEYLEMPIKYVSFSPKTEDVKSRTSQLGSD